MDRATLMRRLSSLLLDPRTTYAMRLHIRARLGMLRGEEFKAAERRAPETRPNEEVIL